MYTVKGIDEKTKRYQRWIARENSSRPMYGLIWEPDIPPLESFENRYLEQTEILPHYIDPREFLEKIEQWYLYAETFPVDTIQRFSPSFGIPWVEAAAGCSVHCSNGSLWAEPCIEELNKNIEIDYTDDNPWIKKIMEFTEYIVEHSRGRYPIATPQMRGPLDTFAAMRTPAKMCTDLLDDPANSIKLLEDLTELWITIADSITGLIPSFQGGYMGRMGTYTEKSLVTLQNDVSTLLSTDMYKSFVLPLDRRITEHFDATEFHSHASESHQMTNLTELASLTTIEFTLENSVGGYSLDRSLPAVKHILKHKPIILACYDIETAEFCAEELDSKGLLIALAANGEEIPEHFLDWLEEKCT
jgi:hypothetical protein